MTREGGAADDLGFTFRAFKSGDVEVRRGGRVVTLLRGDAARSLLARLAALSPDGQQQLLARATGHYRQGNERGAGRHPRNR